MNSMRHEVYRAREFAGNLRNPRLAGYSFKNETEEFYTIKLFFLPENTYYLSKNNGPGYTLFAKILEDENGKTSFQNPVGYGRLLDHLKSHLYLKFPDLDSHLYMCLFPMEMAA